MITKKQLHDQVKEPQSFLDNSNKIKTSILLDGFMKGEIYPASYVLDLEKKINEQSQEIGRLRYYARTKQPAPLHIVK